MSDLLFGVIDGHEEAQSGAGHADRRIDDRLDVDAVFQKLLTEPHALVRIANDQGKDRGVMGRSKIQPLFLGDLAEEASLFLQLMDAPRLPLQNNEGGERGGGVGRRQANGENEAWAE